MLETQKSAQKALSAIGKGLLLMAASMYGHTNAVNVLLQYGANVALTDNRDFKIQRRGRQRERQKKKLV